MKNKSGINPTNARNPRGIGGKESASKTPDAIERRYNFLVKFFVIFLLNYLLFQKLDTQFTLFQKEITEISQEFSGLNSFIALISMKYFIDFIFSILISCLAIILFFNNFSL